MAKKKLSLKELEAKAAQEEELRVKELAEKEAVKRYTAEQLKKWQSENDGIWFLPFLTEDGKSIDKMLVLKSVDRNVLSFAMTKMEDEGMYGFLESAMREHTLDGDAEIFEDEDLFLGASKVFQKAMEGRKAFMLKR